MKIVSLTTFPVPPRWLFLKVETGAGIAGWGEPIVEGRAATVATAVEELSDYLVGRDALRIEDHWQVLTKDGFYRGGPVLSSAVAGIDQALWDVAGKALGVPVYQLLGGPVRERARIYAWIGGDDPGEVRESAAERVEQGYTAVKMVASGELFPIDSPAKTAKVVAKVAAAREAMGDENDVAVDFHGRVSKAMAKRLLAELVPYRLLFVEEPVLPEHPDALALLAVETPVPLATGERLYSRADFKPVLPYIDVAQPDVSHAGGISETRRIAAMAEAYDVAVAPHCPLGPIALAASLQLAFATPNFLVQEQQLDVHRNAPVEYLASIFRYEVGYVARPLAPGLGIEVDETAVRRAAEVGHRWRNPVERHPDGSFAEW